MTEPINDKTFAEPEPYGQSPSGQQAPYGQPAPFDPATLPPRTTRQGRTNRSLLPIVGVIAIAVVAFGGGFGVANLTAPKVPANPFGGRGGDGNFRPTASGQPRGFGGGGGFGGGAAGTIGSVSSDQMTLTTANGQRIVLLTPTTTVTEISSATKALSDLSSGQTVTIVGTSNPDGSVTATTVIVGDIAGIGGLRFGGGPGASAAP